LSKKDLALIQITLSDFVQGSTLLDPGRSSGMAKMPPACMPHKGIDLAEQCRMGGYRAARDPGSLLAIDNIVIAIGLSHAIRRNVRVRKARVTGNDSV